MAAPRGSVEDHLPYAAAADFYGIDIYPVPAGSHSNLEDRTLTSVGKYARRADAMQEYRKPVLMTLQAFAWGELSKRKRIYPTLVESRFMAYDALLNGATHIAYYSLRHVIDMILPGSTSTTARPASRPMTRISLSSSSPVSPVS